MVVSELVPVLTVVSVVSVEGFLSVVSFFVADEVTLSFDSISLPFDGVLLTFNSAFVLVVVEEGHCEGG